MEKLHNIVWSDVNVKSCR